MKRNRMNRTGFVKAVGAGAIGVAGAAMMGSGVAHAQTPPSPMPAPITAEGAFDMRAADQKVAIVDVRSKEEYYWVGTAAEVDQINTMDGNVYYPDRGKVMFIGNLNVFQFTQGSSMSVPVKQVQSMQLTPIAELIPFLNFEYVDIDQDGLCDYNIDRAFFVAVYQLKHFDKLVFICKTGERAYFAAMAIAGFLAGPPYNIPGLPPDLFSALYFTSYQQGSYNNSYNGYVGFPGRNTSFKAVESTSWFDKGLPIVTGLCPWEPEPE